MSTYTKCRTRVYAMRVCVEPDETTRERQITTISIYLHGVNKNRKP